MESVGFRLRAARENKQYSLEDIQSRTRINLKNLAAIERDAVGDISSPFFYRSFVRQYAEEVDVDYKVLAVGVEELTSRMRPPDLPGQGDHNIVRVAPLKPRIKRDWSWLTPTAIFLGFIALGSGGYGYYRYYGPSAFQPATLSAFASKVRAQLDFGRTSEAPTVAKVIEKTPASVVIKAPANSPVDGNNAPPATVVANAGPAPVPTQTPGDFRPSPPAASVSIPDKIHLELEATERTWLSVSADGKTAYTGILEPLETKVLDGQDTAMLRTGNAGGVSITFNGKLIGPVGPRGTTRTVVFSRTGYAISPAERSNITRSNHIGG